MTWYGYSALSLGRLARRAAGCGAVLIAAWLVATPTTVYGSDPVGWLNGGNTPPTKTTAPVRIPGTTSAPKVGSDVRTASRSVLKSAPAKVENRYQLPTAKPIAAQPQSVAKATAAKLNSAKAVSAQPINLVSANRPVSNIGPIPAAPRQLQQPAQKFAVNQAMLGHGQIMGGPDQSSGIGNAAYGASAGWNGQRPWAGPSPYAQNNPWAGQWPVPYGGYIYSPAACDYTPPCVMNLWDGYCQRPLRCNPLGSHGCKSCGTGNCGAGNCGSGGCGTSAGGCAPCGSGLGGCGKVRSGLPVMFNGHHLGRSATCDSCDGAPSSAGPVHSTGTPTPAALAPPSVDEGQHVPAESLYNSGEDVGPIPATPTPAEAKPMEPMPESVPEVASPAAVPAVPKLNPPKVDAPKEVIPAPAADEDLLPKPKEEARAARFSAPRSLYNRPVGPGLPTLSAPR